MGPRPVALTLSEGGAWCALTDPLIAIAPYSFPVLTLPAMLIVPFIPEQHHEAILLSVGLAAGADVGVAIRHFFNTNNLSRGYFASFRLGFFVGTPFCVMANLLILEWISIWLYDFPYKA